ncbi:MAG: hypothetical protein ACI4RA_00555 [Kiritimatiellia bacterium]
MKRIAKIVVSTGVMLLGLAARADAVDGVLTLSADCTPPRLGPSIAHGGLLGLATVKLDRPFFGSTKARISRDPNGVPMDIRLNGAFRRGMPRAESLAKLSALRDEVSGRVGFDVGEYRFSTQDFSDGVAESAGGGALWLDMDTVYACAVATNAGIEVAVRCSVNSESRSNSGGASCGGGDSPVEFTVVVTKISAREAERRRLHAAREREERRRSLRLTEFYGVDFTPTSGISTNTLVRKEFSGTTVHDGKTNHFVRAYWEREDRNLRPADLFDFAQVRYSYGTVVADGVVFYGHFKKGMSRRDCIARLTEFARGMDARYGIELRDQPAPPDEAEPAGFVPGEPPAHLEKCESRYFFDSGERFFCREFQNGKVFVRLAAGETSHGERCVRLDVSQRAPRVDSNEDE